MLLKFANNLLKTFTILLIIATSVIYFIRTYSVNVATQYGADLGEKVGQVNGKYDGLKDGLTEGKHDGLNADDTTVFLSNYMQKTGNIQVLSSTVTFTAKTSIGEQMKSVKAFMANASYSVDLSKAQITNNGNSISIVLPEPELDLSVDSEKTTELFKKIHLNFTSDIEALNAYLKAYNDAETNIEENIVDYEDLKQQAHDSAIEQIEQFAGNLTDSELVVTIAESGGEQQ